MPQTSSANPMFDPHLKSTLLHGISTLRDTRHFWVPLRHAALCGGILLMGAEPARAESRAVLNKLVKKGLLTQQEADEIVAEEAAEAAKKAPVAEAAPAEAPKAPEAAKPADAAKPAETGALGGRPKAPHKAPETDAIGQKKDQHWYDRLRVDGYMQLRYTEQLNNNADLLDVPNDKSVKPTEGLLLRRGRIKITGDATSHLHIYTQMDVQGSTGGSSLSLQARDFYADLDIDDAGEHRMRAGLSKVPYGWSNMQSSQNRIAIERPDALNSAVEGERDYGIYYMWASKEERDIFKALLKEGLKGSGDYGVLTAGIYNGQGLNKPDLNGEPHVLARLAYPWKTKDGQYYEAGVGGYVGKYVVSTAAITPVGGSTALTPGGGTEFRDDRVSAFFVMYPQPFGFETEWTYGTGPELNGGRTRIDDTPLWGGYILFDYRIQYEGCEFIPFVRWNYYEGGRKFGTNSPKDVVNETDLGIECQFGKSWEFTLSYTYTKDRTNTSATPYNTIHDAHRLTGQLQFNF